MSVTAAKRSKIEIQDEASSDNASSTENESGGEEQEKVDDFSGWADSISKVLRATKPDTKKVLVLSRAKKSKPKEEKPYDFEIDGEVKDKKVEEKLPAAVDNQPKAPRNMHLPLRVKPTWQDMERERALRQVATRGVVQLFNAVRVQQKELQTQLDEAGPLDSRKEAVLKNINKRKFLDVLMSGNRAKSEAIDNSIKTELKQDEQSDDDDGDDNDEDSKARKGKSEWNVLKEDFMTNKKNKHWDEEEENSDVAGSNEEEENSDESDN